MTFDPNKLQEIDVTNLPKLISLKSEMDFLQPLLEKSTKGSKRQISIMSCIRETKAEFQTLLDSCK